METIQELLGSVRDSFFQLIENIIEWFQSLRGTNPEISNEEMPDGPASRTRSTSTPPPPEYYIMLKILQKKEENLSESSTTNEGVEEEHSN